MPGQRWRIVPSLVLGLALFGLAPAVPTAPVSAAVQAQQTTAWEPYRYFPATGHNISFDVKRFYERQGDLEVFGLPLTEVIWENGVQVQYFERARLEIHPENKDTDYYILATRLGAVAAEGREAEEPFAWRTGPSYEGATFYPESGHSLGGGFRDYWTNHGGLYTFGYPISEEFSEVNAEDGQTYTVQYFERARMEWHPEHAGTKWEIQQGLLGKQYITRMGIDQNLLKPAREVQKLGGATTYYRGSNAERINNIKRSADRFKGITVKAGQVFSFNQNVGDVSEEAGFTDGYAIVNGKLEKVVGGGLCQVSTTMYRAVFNSGLPIVERYGHSYIVYYYENILGFDATVFVPEVDFRWKNDLGTDIFMWTDTDTSAGRVTFTLWGYGDGRRASMEGPTYSNEQQPGKPVWQYDKTMRRGAVEQLVHGRAGMDVTMYRVITNANGATNRERFFTRYYPWEDFYLYGPGVKPPAGVTIAPPRHP
ncbi:VanW family protein [Herpetosiphon llansteffanensis]|uniref:VanW family protein n=1 Tax=Herpetosiphon llansteffanensis TaxID=2094568 RepID=UPI000D7C1115|nr:VanW family protein [Herpetosiphon llansteffanensis]